MPKTKYSFAEATSSPANVKLNIPNSKQKKRFPFLVQIKAEI